MATALSYPTISGVTGAPYISALSDTANIQDTINYLYYGSTKAAVVTDGIYGMLTKLQTQISAVQSGVNVHENAKMATTGALGTTGNLLGGTITTTYANGTADASGGTGIGATLTIATNTNWTSITIDGQSLVVDDRVLIKDQASAIQNGIYVVTSVGAVGNTTSFVFTRSEDSNNSIAGEMAEGDFLYVANGNNNANKAYVLTASSATGTGPAGSIKIGTDSVNYTQFIGVGSYYIGTTSAQILSANQALTGISSIAMPSGGGGTFTLTPASTASSFSIIIPAVSDTLVGKTTTDILTNKSLSDSTTYFVDASDNTKRVNLDVTGTTGITGILQTAFTTAKTIVFPDTAGTVYVSSGTDVALADGGTNASLTASNGGIVYSTASAMAILSGTATAGKHLQSGSSTTPSWTTSTYSDTYAVNTLLYAGTANTITGLATANSGVLVTSASGVPSISTTIPAVTLTTPTIDTINTSLTTTGTAALWNTGLTTGTISIGGALTTGTLNIGSGTAGAKTVNIGTSTGTVNINGTLTVNGTIADATTTTAARGVGYMGLPQNATTTGSYTIVAGDAGGHIYASATRTVTIPANGLVAFPIGTTLTFIAGAGATMTIAITTDTMYLAGSGTTGSRTLAAYGIATAVKTTATTWLISGNGLT